MLTIENVFHTSVGFAIREKHISQHVGIVLIFTK